MNTAWMLNNICRLMYMQEYRRFIAPQNVRRVQLGYLYSLLQKNAGTMYGRKYGFGEIRSYREFARRVPLTVYEDYEPYIEMISNGRSSVLTSEPVKLFEPTSGSSGGKKLIPYTRSLQSEFQRGIRPWLCDLYTNIPGLCSGKSYWSITPVTAGKTYTSAGIPIGFEEDAAYFGVFEQLLMRGIFAVDSSVKFTHSTEQFYHDTAVQLLRCPRLTLISVWNPTFLTILCRYIKDNAPSLLRELPECREQIAAAQKGCFENVFCGLRLISCWADGSAAEDAKELGKLFHGVYIQPKGLLATECFASLPLVGEEGARLSIGSHFFEFLRISDGRISTADRLERGEYELIVTTGGGFYRYRTGDIVRVLDTEKDRPPRIRFLRRRGISSDLCGEKLTEDFVRGVCKALGIADNFCLLAPEGKGYTLYTNAASVTDYELDKTLRESYHYDYCRSLGQLRMAEVVHVNGEPERVYLERLASGGMRLGDIKPAFLSTKSGWRKYFGSEEKP